MPAAAAQSANGAIDNTSRQTVAIVDDDTRALSGLRRLLEAADFATETYDSAEAFLARDGAAMLSCIVLDVHMPGMSGIELLGRLRALGSKVPVLMLTAIDDAEVRSQAFALGCAAFLSKPIAGQVLIDCIRNAAGL